MIAFIRDLWKLKLKVFFGSLKASKVSLILFLLYSLSMFPAIVGIVSMSLTVTSEVDLMIYIDTLAALLSGLLALNLLSAYRGITAFEYEQSFIFTAPVTPRQFLIASLLADGAFSLLFLYPLPVIAGGMIFVLNLSTLPTVLLFLSFLLFFLFTVFLRYSFSIMGAFLKTMWFKVLTTVLILLLLYPAIGIFATVDLNYRSLPYPTTFIAQILLRALSNEIATNVALLGFSVYFGFSLALFSFSANKNFFQVASSAPLISAFDMSMGMQTRKVDMNIRLFSRFGLKLPLTSDSSSLLTFLMKKEFIRILRDGSLFVIFLFYSIISVISVVGSARGMPLPIWLFLLVLYSFMIPLILVSNWRMVELKNLWIPLTSNMNLRYLVESTLYVFTLLASSVPVVVIAVLTVISRIDPLLPLVVTVSVSVIGCSVNLYVATRFLGRDDRATPSIIISWMSLLMTGLLLSPVYAFMVFNLLWSIPLELQGVLSVLSLAYSIVIFTLLSKAIGKNVLSIEL